MPYSPMQLAEVFIKTGELSDALDALNQQLTDYPDDDVARRMRIDVLMRLTDETQWKQALRDVNMLPSLTANDHRNASIVHERLGSLEDAATAMQEAIKMAPGDERLIERYLQLLIAQKKYDEALKLVRERDDSWRWLQWEGDVLVLLGDDMTATARYGLVLAQLEEREGAMRQDYLDALKARVLLARAHAYRRLEHIEIAREHYETAQTLIKDDPTIDFNLGLLNVLEGNFDEGVEKCKTALEGASPAMHEEMLESIKSEAFYQVLSAKLNKN